MHYTQHEELRLATKESKFFDNVHQSVAIGNPQGLVLCYCVSILYWNEHVQVPQHLHRVPQSLRGGALNWRGRGGRGQELDSMDMQWLYTCSIVLYLY